MYKILTVLCVIQLNFICTAIGTVQSVSISLASIITLATILLTKFGHGGRFLSSYYRREGVFLPYLFLMQGADCCRPGKFYLFPCWYYFMVSKDKLFLLTSKRWGGQENTCWRSASWKPDRKPDMLTSYKIWFKECDLKEHHTGTGSEPCWQECLHFR